MKSSFRIAIKTKRLCYNLTINRNITIIQGESGTGKTTLLNYITMFQTEQMGVSISVESVSGEKASVGVLTDGSWKLFVDSYKNYIFFIDEDNKFVTSPEFIKRLKDSTHYFVFITRHTKNLAQYPCSVDEVYELKSSGKYLCNSEYVTYTSNTRVWNPYKIETSVDVVITEDEASGYTFFKRALNTNVVAAKGNSNVIPAILKYCATGQKTLAIIDGAAYGAYLSDLAKAETIIRGLAVFCFPESFEWLLLHSIIFDKFKSIQEILQDPYNKIDSSKFVSWEKYFEHLLAESCKALGFTYNKSAALNKRFLTANNVQRLLGLIGINLTALNTK